MHKSRNTAGTHLAGAVAAFTWLKKGDCDADASEARGITSFLCTGSTSSSQLYQTPSTVPSWGALRQEQSQQTIPVTNRSKPTQSSFLYTTPSRFVFCSLPFHANFLNTTHRNIRLRCQVSDSVMRKSQIRSPEHNNMALQACIHQSRVGLHRKVAEWRRELGSAPLVRTRGNRLSKYSLPFKFEWETIATSILFSARLESVFVTFSPFTPVTSCGLPKRFPNPNDDAHTGTVVVGSV